jgi:hypothetical protein
MKDIEKVKNFVEKYHVKTATWNTDRATKNNTKLNRT